MLRLRAGRRNVATGETDKLAAAFGGSIFDGRGHVTAFIEKTDTSPILQGDYDISACALTGGKSGCGGSSTIPPGRWADFGRYAAAGHENTADPSVTRLDLKVLGDEFVPRDGQTFNYNPTNFFQRPDERLNAGFFGRFEIGNRVEGYVNVHSLQSESNAQIAYSGTFGNITAIPCYNALLSRQQYDTVCGNWTTRMGGDHAPDFASAAEALAYISQLDLALGAQNHEEAFGIVAGDTASWAPGGFETQGFSVGANGFQGFSTDIAGRFIRDSAAAYVQLDVDVTDRWVVDRAARYERYSDFGSTANGKFATRFQVSPPFALRGSLSTGFRAPSVGQSNLRRAATTFRGGMPAV